MLHKVDFATGSVSPDQDILWDERDDGPFPVELLDKVGGIVKTDGNLVVDGVKLAAKRAADSAKSRAKEDQLAALSRVKAIDPNTVTDPLLKDIVLAIRGGV